MSSPITKGANHIGLTVSKLEASAAFFTAVLGWKEVRRNAEYPAIFVSDGSITLTLWAAKEASPVAFNRKANVGLHHLALQVESEAALNEVHQRVLNSVPPDEFPPELLRQGPAKHMMCFEQSGIRLELIWTGQ